MTKAAAQEIWSFKGQLEEKLLQRPMTIKKQSQIEKKKKSTITEAAGGQNSKGKENSDIIFEAGGRPNKEQ